MQWIRITEDNIPDDTSFCLWCAVPIVEPPYSGSILNTEFPGIDKFTHFMEMKNEFFPTDESAPTSADKGLREELSDILGTVNFSSHKQMREAIEGAMDLLNEQPATPPGGERREDIENACIDSLLKEFNRQGFDTSNWDGDEGWEKAIVDGVSHLTGQGEWVSVDNKNYPPTTDKYYYWLYHSFNDSYSQGSYDYDENKFVDTEGYELFGVTHYQIPTPPIQ